MSNHFTHSKKISQKATNVPTFASPPAFNLRARKETVFIDLIDSDDTSLPQNHSVSQEQNIQDMQINMLEDSVASNQMPIKNSKETQRSINPNRNLLFFRTPSKQPNRPSTVECIDVDYPNMGLSRLSVFPHLLSKSLNCTHPTYNPQFMQMRQQPSAINYGNRKPAVQRYQEGEKSLNGQGTFYQAIVDLAKSEAWSPYEASFIQDYPAKMKLSLSQNASECLTKANGRKTRSSGLSQSMNTFDLKYADNETKTRFKVAKYRYSIPQHVRAIRQLAADVLYKAPLDNGCVIVQNQPTIPPNSDKHKVFVSSLRLQLNKRKFINLDGGTK